MFTIKNKSIQAFLDKLIPTRKLTVYSERYDPISLAQDLDVDYLHNILNEAQTGNTMRLFALYRDVVEGDSHIQGELAKRKMAVIGDPMTVQPFDKTNADDVAASVAVNKMFEDYEGLDDVIGALMDSVLWPVCVVEKLFKPSSKPGLRYELNELVPVPYQLLDYSNIRGQLMIWDADPATGARMASRNAPDLNRYMIHRGHLLRSPDYRGGPMRALLFWWLLGAMDRDWWARFLERYGSPFMKGKYNQNDDAGRMTLQKAFSNATRLFGLVISKETEVELVQASTQQSGEAFEKFLQICQREKSKLIVGQTLSAEAQPTGLGSHVGKNQETVRQDIRKYDASKMGSTLRHQLAKQYLEINGLPGRPPKIIWGGDTPEESKDTGDLLVSITQAGLRVTDQALPGLSEKLGIEVERGASPPPALSEPPRVFAASLPRRAKMADDANLSIARDGAASLALAFRGSFAPVRKLILESHSPADLEQKIRSFYADWSPDRVAPLIEEALVAFAANGSVVHESEN